MFNWSFSISQENPKYTNPVKHNIRLSGSFAELRTGHFHGGIDIKSSSGIKGDTIFSIQKGIISRLKVEPGGYGNSIYIDHPEGYTSVYAHLDSFNPKIDSLIKKHQYATNTFLVDISSFQEAMYINKGEYIAIMGNTGRSFGPHLHFEIRETATDKLINPFLIGIKPADTRSPTIKYIELKEFDTNNLPIANQTLTINNTSKSKNGKQYDLGKLEINTNNQYDLSIAIFDQMNGSSNKNGIYSIQWMQNDSLIQQICMDDIKFEDSYNIYDIMDLQKKLESNAVNYLFHLNRLHSFSFSKNGENPFDSKNPVDAYTIIFSDFEANQTSITYQIVKNQSPDIILSPSFKPNYILTAGKQALIETENFDIFIPEQPNLVQQGIFISEVIVNSQPALILEPKDIPLTNEIIIRFKSETARDHILSWISTNDNGEQDVINTCPRTGICQVVTNKFKNISLEIDTIAPIVNLINPKPISGESLKIEISDNYKPDNKSQYLQYDVFINNKWCLFNYDLKNDVIISDNNNCLSKGRNNISVIVNDSSGNENCSNFLIEIK